MALKQSRKVLADTPDDVTVMSPGLPRPGLGDLKHPLFTNWDVRRFKDMKVYPTQRVDWRHAIKLHHGKCRTQHLWTLAFILRKKTHQSAVFSFLVGINSHFLSNVQTFLCHIFHIKSHGNKLRLRLRESSALDNVKPLRAGVAAADGCRGSRGFGDRTSPRRAAPHTSNDLTLFFFFIASKLPFQKKRIP